MSRPGAHIQISLRTKLMVLLVGTCAAVLLVACVAFVVQDRRGYAQSKEQTLRVLAEAIAGSAYGPTAFQDSESATYVIKTLQSERTFLNAAIYKDDGERLVQWGDQAAAAAPGRLDGVVHKNGFYENYLYITQDIKNPEGKVGELYLVFSTHDIDERTAEFIQVALAVLLFSVLMTVLLSFKLHHPISRPILALVDAARKVEHDQDFSVRVAQTTGDEVGRLTASFNEMLDMISSRDRDLAGYRDELEHKVQERTAELDRRNEAMRVVLDHVDQGLVTLNLDGQISPERSSAFDRLFGRPSPGQKMVQHLHHVGEDVATWFELGWESLQEGFLPTELAIEQLPQQVVYEGRHLKISYKPIMGGEEIAQVLVIVSDQTSEVERQRAEAAQREFLDAFERVLKDRRGFLSFMEEADVLVDWVSSPGNGAREPALMMRKLHTLKGNFGLFGLQSLASRCHHMETQWSEEGALKGEEVQGLQAQWGHFKGRIEQLLGKSSAKSVEIQERDLEQLQEAIRSGQGASELLGITRRWFLEPAHLRLEVAAALAQQIAARLEKPALKIEVDANEVRLDAQRWKPFWSNITHLIRNAVDHGIEPAEERQAAGKSPQGHLRLRAFYLEERCVIEVSDDGRGLAWERIAAKAAERGLPHQTHEELKAALFADNLTTREEAGEFSGRGVGLSAVKQMVEGLGGWIEVQSEPGEGTSFFFHVPLVEAQAPASWDGDAERPQPSA
jgi:two-component system chemotaxis sensor kinase CheA